MEAGERPSPRKKWGMANEEPTTGFPSCIACNEGVLVPLSDFGGQGAAVHYKAWVCTSPRCEFNLKIRNGDVIANEPIYDGRDDPR